MSIFKSIGKAIGGAIKGTVGKLPIVGGAATHIGNAFSGKEPFLKGIVGGGLPLLLGAGSFGLGPAAGLLSKIGGAVGGKAATLGTSGFGSTLGGAARSALGKLGKLNAGQLAGLGSAGASVLGAAQQRGANQKYLNSQTDMRNQLMSRLLSGSQQTYNFAPER